MTTDDSKVDGIDINIWLSTLRLAWETKNYNLVSEHFKHCKKYIESSFHPPLSTPSEIVAIWREIESHSELVLEFRVLARACGLAIVNFDANYLTSKGPRHSNGIYHIEFDAFGRCIAFRQWSEAM